MSLTANISAISRASLHDGPGSRTVVYFKGCGLRCRWCHNPETLAGEQEILFAPQKCIHCGRCVAICPEHHVIRGQDAEYVRSGCSHCGRCADACPAGALTVSGKSMTAEELMIELRKDLPYYQQTSGGVTLSGGECLLQADFCRELLTHCRQEGIQSVIETALFVPWAQVEKVLPLCDLFFADFKIPDPDKHRLYTGQDNRQICQNLYALAEQVGNRLTVRIPLIPGVNDSDADIAGFGGKLLPIAHLLGGIEVLRYNPMAQSKYVQSGREYADFGQMQSDEAMLSWCKALQNTLDHQVNVYTVL